MVIGKYWNNIRKVINMGNNIQSNEEKRCIICNKPYNYHYDLFGRSCLTNLYKQLNISNSRLISNKVIWKQVKKKMKIGM